MGKWVLCNSACFLVRVSLQLRSLLACRCTVPLPDGSSGGALACLFAGVPRATGERNVDLTCFRIRFESNEDETRASMEGIWSRPGVLQDDEPQRLH